jgi:Ca-activated chloride channel family protein
VGAAEPESQTMSFSAPAWLALLALVPPLVVLLIRRSADMPRGRRAGFIALRALALALLVLALAGLGLSRGSDRIDLLLLLDSSDSVDEEARRSALETFDGLRARLRPDDGAGIVRFGADADVERLPAGSRAAAAGGPGSAGSAGGGRQVDASATDIEAALLSAVAQFGDEGSRRILLASDGAETRGDAAAGGAVARASGVEVHVLPIASPPGGGEVLVRDVSAPSGVRAGETREVTVVVRSRARTPARIALLRDGGVAAARALMLEPGENAIPFEVAFPQRGLAAVTAVVEADADRFAENNRFTRLVEVAGSPAVLFVSSPDRRSAALLDALTAQGIRTVTCDAAGAPGTLAAFLPYDAVVLDDVPGFSFSWEKMETIERFVRDAGGGLLMIGGPHSFGAGGWFETPVERALPVDMDVTSQAELPRLALVIVTDKSGSMGGMVPTGETKLDVVKSAALSVLEVLNPFDRVGLLAFDADTEWTVPLTEAQNRDQIAADLATLQPGGGTVLYPALEEAYQTLAGIEAAVKHVIVLSDGLTNPGEFERLARAMRAAKITVSTVAVGDDADRELMASIATWAGGRTYATQDPRNVPRIFMTETMLASRGLIVESRFLPQASGPQELLAGIAPSSLPPLLGFVLTYPKQGATRVLGALQGAPLLATWHYGLGRSAAFTSDLAGRWGREWVAWESLPRFAAQLVRWIEPPASSEVLHPSVSVARGRGTISVDAWDALGEFANGLDVSAVVAGPRRDRREVTLPQSGPGHYEAAFTAGEVGDYVASVSARAQDGTVSVRTVGVSVPYPEEYLDTGTDRRLLEGLAAATGGGVVNPDDDASLERLVRRERGASSRNVALWPLLAALGLACFFLDVAARKLTLPEGLRERLVKLFGRKGGARGWSYEELAAMVQQAREEERRKLRERIAGMRAEGKVSSDLAAYLYIARMRSGRQGSGGTAKASPPGKKEG